MGYVGVLGVLFNWTCGHCWVDGGYKAWGTWRESYFVFRSKKKHMWSDSNLPWGRHMTKLHREICQILMKCAEPIPVEPYFSFKRPWLWIICKKMMRIWWICLGLSCLRGGWLHAIQLVLQVREGGLVSAGPPCGSFIYLNMATSGRSKWTPLGGQRAYVKAANRPLDIKRKNLQSLECVNCIKCINKNPVKGLTPHHHATTEVHNAIGLVAPPVLCARSDFCGGATLHKPDACLSLFQVAWEGSGTNDEMATSTLVTCPIAFFLWKCIWFTIW